MKKVTSTTRTITTPDGGPLTAGDLRDIVSDEVGSPSYHASYDVPRDAQVTVAESAVTFTWETSVEDDTPAAAVEVVAEQSA